MIAAWNGETTKRQAMRKCRGSSARARRGAEPEQRRRKPDRPGAIRPLDRFEVFARREDALGSVQSGDLERSEWKTEREMHPRARSQIQRGHSISGGQSS